GANELPGEVPSSNEPGQCQQGQEAIHPHGKPVSFGSHVAVQPVEDLLLVLDQPLDVLVELRAEWEKLTVELLDHGSGALGSAPLFEQLVLNPPELFRGAVDAFN